jgi:ketosteroid isomerase-like protein
MVDYVSPPAMRPSAPAGLGALAGGTAARVTGEVQLQLLATMRKPKPRWPFEVAGGTSRDPMAARARLRRYTDESSSPSATASLPSGAPTGGREGFRARGLPGARPGRGPARGRAVRAPTRRARGQRERGRAVVPAGSRHDGRRLDTPVLGLCHVRDGGLARAQMFYFDTADVVRFPAAGNLALDR